MAHPKFPVCDKCSMTIGVWVDNGNIMTQCGCDEPIRPVRLTDMGWKMQTGGQVWQFKYIRDTGILEVSRIVEAHQLEYTIDAQKKLVPMGQPIVIVEQKSPSDTTVLRSGFVIEV